MKELDYTQEMYEEDSKIIKWFICKVLNNYPCLKNYIQDMQSVFLMTAYNCRKNFDPTRNIKYATYLIKSLKLRVKKFYEKYYEEKKLNILSLDMKLSEKDENFSLNNILSYEEDFNKNIDYNFMLDIIKKEISKSKNIYLKDVCYMLLKGERLIDISKKFGFSRQYAKQLQTKASTIIKTAIKKSKDKEKLKEQLYLNLINSIEDEPTKQIALYYSYGYNNNQIAEKLNLDLIYIRFKVNQIQEKINKLDKNIGIKENKTKIKKSKTK